MTIEALVQQAYSAHVIYGLSRPIFDWGVFGPYTTKNLFAGYMLMAVALGMGFCLEALDELRRAWRRRRKRAWLALGDAEGNAFLRWVSISMVLVSGLLATGSRGGLLGLGTLLAALVATARRRRSTTLAVAGLATLGIVWIGLAAQRNGFISRGSSMRVDIWTDSVAMVPDHPLFGAGFNAFGTSYPPRQRVWRTLWIGTTHNDYLQVLIDTGIAGFVPFVAMLVVLVRRGFASARNGPVHAGVFAGLAGVMAHNIVDYNWQLAANAATFVALAALAVQTAPHLDPLRRPA
jgi:O-antigen ligase